MTLLEELKSERDYWIVPTSPTGFSDHPDVKIMHVRKGVNTETLRTGMLNGRPRGSIAQPLPNELEGDVQTVRRAGPIWHSACARGSAGNHDPLAAGGPALLPV